MAEKLVRDRIPEIIRRDGQEPQTRILGDDEYLKALDAKLMEEVHEYLADNDLHELEDILEVVRAIAVARGSTYDAIEEGRQKKLSERGGFLEKISLTL